MTDDLPELRTAAAVLFDLDGVLTPTAEVHMRAWQTVFDAVFAEWQITPAYTSADYYAYVDGKKRYDGVAAVMRSRNVEIAWGSPDDAPEAHTICGVGNRKNAAFAAALTADGIAPYPGSLALVQWLHGQQIPMAVVSSSRNAGEVLAVSGLTAFFSAVIDGVIAERDHLPSKPDPAMFRAGAAALGVEAAACVAFEDAVAGVRSAADAGCRAVVGVDRGAGAAALRAHGASHIVTDLAAFIPCEQIRSDVPNDQRESK